MIKNIIRKLLSAVIPAFFAMLTISLLAYIISLNILSMIMVVSFGATMVLMFGYPKSPFAHPKNILFGHSVTTIAGIVMCSLLQGPTFFLLGLSVGFGIYLMMIFNVVHPPAGGNPIAVVLANHTYDYLLQSIVLGAIIIILLGYFIHNLILDNKYP
tara:strand:- start:415 stop:885 length:471 start_codon:yes stop_codon:yes gene_type:complete